MPDEDSDDSDERDEEREGTLVPTSDNAWTPCERSCLSVNLSY
jgi:hypothetical protein